MTPQVSFLPSNDETRFFEVTSSKGDKKYEVMHDVDHHWLCTCPHYFFRKVFCKHMKACADEAGIDDRMVYAEVKDGSN